MKNLSVFAFALFGIIAVFYLGASGIAGNSSWGPFLLFIGGCTAIGLTIDIFNHFRTKGSR